MTLYRRFRIWLCHSGLAMHDLEDLFIAHGLDVTRCKFCGKHFAVDVYTHKIHDVVT